MSFENPKPLSPEEQERLRQEAKLTKEKSGHDVEAMEQGAEYLADEDSESPRLEFTRNQLEAARREMFGDIIKGKESKVAELEDTAELLDITVFEMRKSLEEALYAVGMDRGQVEKIVQNAIGLAKERFRMDQENIKSPGAKTPERIQAEADYRKLHKEREVVLKEIRERKFS